MMVVNSMNETASEDLMRVLKSVWGDVVVTFYFLLMAVARSSLFAIGYWICWTFLVLYLGFPPAGLLAFLAIDFGRVFFFRSHESKSPWDKFLVESK